MRGLPEIETAFQEASGKTVILVGHVEDESFVIRDPKNEVTLSTLISTLRSLANKHQVELVDLGCRTAQAIESEIGLGVTTRFNTVEAVESIERAVSKSQTYAEFFENLTSDGLKVVVDRTFVENLSLRADIYSEIQNQPFWVKSVKVAELFVSFKRSQ